MSIPLVSPAVLPGQCDRGKAVPPLATRPEMQDSSRGLGQSCPFPGHFRNWQCTWLSDALFRVSWKKVGVPVA